MEGVLLAGHRSVLFTRAKEYQGGRGGEKVEATSLDRGQSRKRK